MIQFAPEPGGRRDYEGFVYRLLIADWEDPQGPLRLSSDLAPAELASSPFFQAARVLLQALAESKGTAATASGNLTRIFVRQMFDRMELSQDLRESTLALCKVINEPDVWPLHVARIVSECAGLMARRNKRFCLTRLGGSLLAEAQTGALFRNLFQAYFRKFNLEYAFPFRSVPGIQQSVAVILWRLDRLARDWVPVRGLGPKILLPGVLDQLHQVMSFPGDTEEWILASYIFNPLCEFGLVELRQRPGRFGIVTNDSIRVTPLWRKFISFSESE